MKEEVTKIIDKLDNTDEIKRLRELNNILNSNEEYLSLMKEFTLNKDEYIKNDTFNKEVILLRKKLFSIPELKEYLQLQNNLRLVFTKINNIVLSVLD
ncbi:MAG: YlbF family regulator [Bacilli bacterium]|nr:YlbF family regulator [Bacilli bacterium]